MTYKSFGGWKPDLDFQPARGGETLPESARRFIEDTAHFLGSYGLRRFEPHWLGGLAEKYCYLGSAPLPLSEDEAGALNLRLGELRAVYDDAAIWAALKERAEWLDRFEDDAKTGLQ